MQASLVSFLDALGSKVFWLAATCLIVINGAAIAGFIVTRSRRLVDEWTPKLLAADALLLGVGLGVPLVSALAKMGVRAVGSLFGAGGAPVE